MNRGNGQTVFTLSMFGLVLFWFGATVVSCTDLQLQVITVATKTNDGLRRYMQSAQKYGYDVKVLGFGQEWEGGNMELGVGGGQKINMMKEGLQEFAGRDDLLLMFTDSYDVVFTNTAEELLKKFKKFDARVLFSAEGYCWPNQELADLYPEVKQQESRFLCSGGFIGYAKDIVEIINHKAIRNKEDDQLYYTEIFLDKTLREKWSIKLDTKSEIFQNLHGVLGDVDLKFVGSRSYLYNSKTGTTPIVIHGNGPIKPEFNRIANYLGDGWTQSMGCQSCGRDYISLRDVKDEDFPTVLVAVMIEQPTPFLNEFLGHIRDQIYPKQKIDLFVHNKVKYHDEAVSNFLETVKDEYHSINHLRADDHVTEVQARNWALEECAKRKCQYFFNVDSTSQLRHQGGLHILIETNRTVLAPVLTRPYQLWSNWWGALNKNGFYARSDDYMDIVQNHRMGLWNVPFITGTYLIHGSLVPSLLGAYTSSDLDPDMAFCKVIREMGTFMFVSNMFMYGHQTDPDNFETTHKNNDLFELFNNPWDWELKYIHQNYSISLDPNYTLPMPCPDVFWFPIVTDAFCDELISEMENHGQWSGGRNSHKDERLATGYENVPTVDIHMNQIGFERHWLHFLKIYISKLQQRAYEGYFHDPPHAIMNFVVRYRPDEQPFLKPHHDSSTFTINIALNTPDVDFEGGGCRFIRYNCSVQSTKKGWMLMHPGRLTHYHEGLHTTKGTRYIMVSFVDP
ncbi:procollagen-lysine,2-oxoglutarate 5-dioxygenase 1-like isoform X2 [Mizuhopecten yessoensis]|uniref:procollagen-lysine 5-dioxygenase n=1 Tax=Mizuhopecten yessoensis TaxID=6573 RepID=A0A210PXP3_MIZYE|nr:procollagen-lysine,2-oxoglutarate 5-dioxygenase 1-like isoform X2 [Mizuhopecten yessoensis]OWF41242.1 Procollagen-lysine,2-oxoglutarate 5-dioxygenase 1 [Mizuhopecten yessoensis]